MSEFIHQMKIKENQLQGNSIKTINGIGRKQQHVKYLIREIFTRRQFLWVETFLYSKF